MIVIHSTVRLTWHHPHFVLEVGENQLQVVPREVRKKLEFYHQRGVIEIRSVERASVSDLGGGSESSAPSQLAASSERGDENEPTADEPAPPAIAQVPLWDDGGEDDGEDDAEADGEDASTPHPRAQARKRARSSVK